VYFIVSGNYLGDLLGCTTQRIIGRSKLIKHLILFASLFFFTSLIGGKDSINPWIKLLYTIPVYIIFIISTKSSPQELAIFLILVFIIFFIYLIKSHKFPELDKFEKSYENINEIIVPIFTTNYRQKLTKKLQEIYPYNKSMNRQQYVENINEFVHYTRVQYILAYVALIILIIGFVKYYYKQHKEHIHWFPSLFILGTKCKSGYSMRSS